MRRFFVPALAPAGESLALPEGVRHHLDVLRLGDGARFVLFDGSGDEAHVVREGERARVEARAPAEAVGLRVVLVMAMPKGTKLDEIVRMTTELGVYAIHLAHTAHAVARPDEARAQKKVERWQRIAAEAARQSERATVPEVTPPAPLAAVIARAPSSATRLVAWARGGKSAREVLANGASANGASASTPANEVWLAIGPEGGFSEPELAAFDAAGWARLSLGPTILRVDTAAVAALAQLFATWP